MYLHKFRTLLRDGNSNKEMRLNHQDLKQALEKVLLPYLEEKGEKISQEQQKNIRDFVANAHTAPLGAITYPKTRFEWPSELKPVLTLAQESEFARLSMMVDECENHAAAQWNSPEAIYRQTCYLEQFLVDNKDQHQHVEIVTEKVKNWIKTLYAQWPSLIMKAKNREEITQLINQSFPEHSSINLPKVTAFRNEIQEQIDYLANMDMFPDFYDQVEGKTLADKYQIVLSIYEMSMESNQGTPELKWTLQGLLGLMLKKAYDPIEKQMHRRMSEHQTIEKVFAYLHEFSKETWRAFKDTNLLMELETRLRNEEEKYRSWKELHELERSTKPSRDRYPIPCNLYMFQMHSMRYLGDPSEDPRETIQAIQPIQPIQPMRSEGLSENLSLADWFEDDYNDVGSANGSGSGLPVTPLNQMARKRDIDQVDTQKGDDLDLYCDEEIGDDRPAYKKRK